MSVTRSGRTIATRARISYPIPALDAATGVPYLDGRGEESRKSRSLGPRRRDVGGNGGTSARHRPPPRREPARRLRPPTATREVGLPVEGKGSARRRVPSRGQDREEKLQACAGCHEGAQRLRAA